MLWPFDNFLHNISPSTCAFLTTLPPKQSLCVGEQAEGKKAEKYAHLAPAYLFQPVAIETSAAIGSRSRAFLRELGRRVGAQTGEARSTSYLFQRLSVACGCHGVCPLPRLNPPLSLTVCYDLHCVYVLYYHYTGQNSIFTTPQIIKTCFDGNWPYFLRVSQVCNFVQCYYQSCLHVMQNNFSR